jgi:ribosomal protein S18 acetylase RimI-like enzyme
MIVCGRLICYIECIAVREDLKRRGLGKQAVCQIREFLRSIVKTTESIDSRYIILGMSRETKPCAFFKKLGFSEGLPAEFNCWTDEQLDMAYNHVQPYCADDVVTAC